MANGNRASATTREAGTAFRLTSVRIQNFRCIRDLTLDLDEITVLVGENNSGKTTVLKAIELCVNRRRGLDTRVFDENDYHLADGNASPEAAAPIEIKLSFGEGMPDSMAAELREDLDDVLVLREDGKRQATLQVISNFDQDRADFATESWFLDADGAPMKPATSALLAALRRATPVHFLSALRDAGKHFEARGTFWRAFLSASDLSETDRADFENEFAELNQKLIAAHPPLKQVREHLDRAREVIVFGAGDRVTVDALPARASALLSQARVNMASRHGAKIPLERQGEGTQSLAVLLLFEAYLRRRLAEEGAPAEPITILEEPEAHLHPAAVRVLMDAVKKFPGQKILSTHSGDLLGGLDPGSVRRLVYRDGEVRAYGADFASMSEKDRRTFNRKIGRGRGDLLFARGWLVYEGETEAVLFRGVAEALNINLDRYGIAGLQCSDITPASLFRTANRFGIPWFLVYDGDGGQAKYEPPARENLDGAVLADRCVCPYPNIETFLKNNGFADLYRNDVNKVAAVSQAVERMIEGSAAVPDALKAVLHKVIALAEA